MRESWKKLNVLELIMNQMEKKNNGNQMIITETKQKSEVARMKFKAGKYWK